MQPESFEGYQEFNKDNLVFKLIDLENINTSRVGYVHKNGLMSPAYIRLEKTKNLNSKFYFYNYFNYYNQKIYNFLGSVGVRSAINSSDLLDMDIVNLEINEQEKIVNFIDEKTTHFDSIILKKEALIEKLEEAKKSLISEVVTGKVKVVKTLGGYELVERKKEEMKDSGVEWLGEIPREWDISKIKYEFEINARIGWKALKASEYVEEGCIFLATPNIKGRDIDFTNVNYITKERYDESPEIKLKVDDVLLTKDGSTLGTVNVVRYLLKESTVNSSIAVLRSNKSVKGEYLNYYLKSQYMQSIINLVKDGMGVPHLFQSDIKLFNLLIFDKEEQLKIIKFLDNKVQQLDLLIKKSERQILILKESKQSLISEAVTGKIEVLD